MRFHSPTAGPAGRARSVVLALAAVVVGILTFAPRTAHADCSAPGGIHINEVRYVDGPTPEEGRLNPLVELYNKGASAVGLGGWTITDESGSVVATLPPVTLPAGAHLEVRFETGADELDFSDGIGTVFTNAESVGVFHVAAGAVALFNGPPSPGGIVDFVAWSQAGGPPTGPAVSDAYAAGIWQPGDAVPTSDGERFFTMRLVPDGFDHDLSSDWSLYGWSESDYAALVPGANAVMLSPPDGAGFDPGSPTTFDWTPIDSAQVYELQVASDPGFGALEADAFTHATDTTLALGSGPHYWRVLVSDACGPVATGPAWSLSIFPYAVSMTTSKGRATESAKPPLSTEAFGIVGVPRIMQHKDSGMLCIWDDANNKRPGCTENAGPGGPWDGAHPADHAQRVIRIPIGARTIRFTLECPHCRNYCRRATIQMINAFYGGDLTQDRISYQAMPLERAAGNVVRAPEGDLGHDVPMLVASTGPITQWAVDNSVVTGVFAGPTYAQLKAEIQAGYPVQSRVPGHAIIACGFIDQGSFGFGFPTTNLVLIRDPWPGPGNRDGWQSFNAVNFAGWWRIRPAGAAALAGHKQEPTVTKDTDGDGIVDFDEGYPDYPADRPRRFQCAFNTADTDSDDVGDKQEIRAYTFYNIDHPAKTNNSLDLPDIDRDGLRAELDCDSDNDGDYDGGEDINGNGITLEAGETDPFDCSDHDVRFATDRPLYTTADFVTVTGGTLHADTQYTFYVFDTCPLPLAVNQPWAGFTRIGLATTDAQGNIQPASAGQYAPGCYSIGLDVRRDGRWQHVVTPPAPGVPCATCDLTTTFNVEAATPALFAGPFLTPGAGRVEVEWYVADALPVSALAIERGRAADGPFTTLVSWQGRSAPDGRSAFVDASLTEPGVYYYRITAQTANGPQVIGPVAVDVAAPRLALAAAPNPTPGSTGITLTMPRQAAAKLAIYDSAGRLVRVLFDGVLAMGPQLVRWDGARGDGSPTRPGVYFLRAVVNGQATTTRVVKL